MDATSSSTSSARLRLLTPDDAVAFWQLRLQGFRDEPSRFRATIWDGATYDEHLMWLTCEDSSSPIVGLAVGEVLGKEPK